LPPKKKKCCTTIKYSSNLTNEPKESTINRTCLSQNNVVNVTPITYPPFNLPPTDATPDDSIPKC